MERNLPAQVATDEFVGGDDRPDTLLGWLQSDIAANAPRAQGRSLRAGDRSVQVHSCHGPARQIDVLREVLLGLLADDETLEPRDILVMCPDIETYAPLIAADFGLGEVVPGAHPAHKLRVRLADRSLVQTNPLLAVASQLLTLAGSRVTATEVLDIAHAAPVRARFGFTDDDLESITTWVQQSNIRWGFDREHRAPFGVDFIQNTWRFGLDRILAGVAMSDDSHAWIDTTLPLDDVSSNRVELAGRLAEFVSRLQHTVQSLTGARPLRDWLTALSDAVTAVARVADADAWQYSQLQREFNDILERAGGARRYRTATARRPRDDARTPRRSTYPGELPYRHADGVHDGADAFSAASGGLPGRPRRHRISPARAQPDGDDILARDPMTGERDIRSEDRQLLLDAIGAATEKLIITYTGANEYTGKDRPPAVPLMELLDALDATVGSDTRATVVARASAAALRHQERHSRRALVKRCPISRSPSIPPCSMPRVRCAATVRSSRTSSSSPFRSRRRRRRGAGGVVDLLQESHPWFLHANCSSGCPATVTASRTRCPSESATWTSGRSGTGCSPTSLPAWTLRRRSQGGVAPWTAPAGLGSAGHRPRNLDKAAMLADEAMKQRNLESATAAAV